MDYVSATRKRVVEQIYFRHVKVGDPFFPNSIFKDGAEPRDVWVVYTTTRTGLMPSQISIHHAFSEGEAQEILEKYPVGTEIEDAGNYEGKKRIVRTIIDSGFPIGVAAGDTESPLAFDVLSAAGVYAKDYGPISHEVVKSLGKDRISSIREKFTENWETVAIYEYCFVNLPHSSAAFLAASYQYHYYITGDDFSAGYYWRDLEILVHGVEAEAAKAIATRTRAGGAGGKVSSKARETRRADLLNKLEALGQRSPDITRIGPEALVKIALEDCERDSPALWSQGKGQANEYLGEIRRGEAGEELKSRYHALFSGKPLKQSQ